MLRALKGKTSVHELTNSIFKWKDALDRTRFGGRILIIDTLAREKVTCIV